MLLVGLKFDAKQPTDLILLRLRWARERYGRRRRRPFFFPPSSFLLLQDHSLPFRHIAGSGVEVLTGGGSAREELSTGDVSSASGATVRFAKKWSQGGVGF
ncbi:hypothetical protein Bca4012_035837 [Brassica carinata]